MLVNLFAMAMTFEVRSRQEDEPTEYADQSASLTEVWSSMVYNLVNNSEPTRVRGCECRLLLGFLIQGEWDVKWAVMRTNSRQYGDISVRRVGRRLGTFQNWALSGSVMVLSKPVVFCLVEGANNAQ